ncbi:MAG: Gfo/Idh/MocA family oxidoreductase [Ruminococcaceae bacterium]|nr:Gfo/Idh/MocA family oxidoreductase [Oscillospiraceae bacterium]
MLHIGLIGAGFMGNTHAEVYKLLSLTEDVRLYGVCDLVPEKAKKAALPSSSVVFSTPEELLACPDIHAVDICLPTHLHCAYAKKAMQAGKHIFIEKPVVLTPEEGKELLEYKKIYGTKIMVGQCLRLWDEFVALKEIYQTGKYGALKRLKLNRLSATPDWSHENWYLDIEKSGGAILDLHIHDIDFMRFLLGEPARFKVNGNREYICGMFEYENGVSVQIESGWGFPKSFPANAGYRADFEQAVVCYNGNGVNIYEHGGKRFTEHPSLRSDQNEHIAKKAAQYGGYYNELKYFVQQINSGKEIEIATLREGIQTVELIYKELANV